MAATTDPELNAARGNRIRIARKAAPRPEGGTGYTQQEVANRVPMSQGSYQGIENGRYATTNIVRISEILSCSVIWLETGEGPMSIPPVHKLTDQGLKVVDELFELDDTRLEIVLRIAQSLSAETHTDNTYVQPPVLKPLG